MRLLNRATAKKKVKDTQYYLQNMGMGRYENSCQCIQQIHIDSIGFHLKENNRKSLKRKSGEMDQDVHLHLLA